MFFRSSTLSQAHKIKLKPKLSHNKLNSTLTITETEASDNKKCEQHVIGSKQAGRRRALALTALNLVVCTVAACEAALSCSIKPSSKVRVRT
jgi:hypothetical protein